MAELTFLDKLQNLLDSHLNENLPLADFKSQLDKLYAASQPGAKAVLENGENPELRAVAGDEVALSNRGVGLFEKGFWMWFDYLQKPTDKALLLAGMAAMKEGNDCLIAGRDGFNRKFAPFAWSEHYAAELAVPEVADLQAFYLQVKTYDVHNQGRAAMSDEDRQFGLLTYGNTWPPVMYRLLKHCQITRADHFLDLGCGCGMPVFTAELLAGSAAGVDLVPTVVDFCNKMLAHRPVENVEFHCQDMFKTDLSKATIIYSDPTVFSDELVEKLAIKLQEARPGTKILTLNKPIQGSAFRAVEELPYFCSWSGVGEGTWLTFHLQERLP